MLLVQVTGTQVEAHVVVGRKANIRLASWRQLMAPASELVTMAWLKVNCISVVSGEI